MGKIERVREAAKSPLELNYFTERAAAGWRLVALEWEREVPAAAGEPPSGAPPQQQLTPVPYGLRVSDDCLHLEENPLEAQVLKLMMEGIVQDFPLSRIADELNRRDLRTREGHAWTQVSVFQMLTRVIEIAPQVHSSEDWAERRKRLERVAWNS
jgi:Recombinase